MKLPTDKTSSIITTTPPSIGEFPPQTPPETLLKYLKRVREDMANYIDELDDRIRELEKEARK